MKKIFFLLLRKYSNTEAERMVIYKQLWDKVCEDYSEQNAFGNVYIEDSKPRYSEEVVYEYDTENP